MYDLFKDKKVYHISDSDLDGIGARILGEKFIEPVAKYYVPYNTADRDLPDFSWDLVDRADYILFTDISPPTLDFFKKIKSKCENVFIFDHHQTARDELGDQENYFFDPKICGTKIFFKFLTKGKRVKKIISEFVELVNVYDLYQKERKLFYEGKKLHNTMYGTVNWQRYEYQTDTERYDNFIINQLKKFEKFENFEFLQSELKIIERADKKEETAYREATKSLEKRIDNEGNLYGYFECSAKISFVASRLLEENSDIRYFVGRSTWDSSSLKVSLRSQKDFFVNHIAEAHGGGGHPHASGVELNFETFSKFIKGELHLL